MGMIENIPGYYTRLISAINIQYPDHTIIDVDIYKVGQYEYINVLIKARDHELSIYVLYKSNFDYKEKEETKYIEPAILPYNAILAAADDIKKSNLI